MTNVIKEIAKDLEEVVVPEGYVSKYLPKMSNARLYAKREEEEKKFIVLIDRLIKEQEDMQERVVCAQTDEEVNRWKE